jgi:hypothetical protein
MPRLPKTLSALVAGSVWAGALGALSGCDDLPRDPEETTENVSGAVLRVGWVAGAEPTEIERAAVAGLAARLGAAVEASEGTVHELVSGLEEGTVHLVAGELPEKTPFAREVGLTKRVGTVVLRGKAEPTAMAVRSGENRFLLLANEAIEKARR